MIDQEKIHNLCLSDYTEERMEALIQLRDNFSKLQDQENAWYVVIKLTSDENINVRYMAVSVLYSIFPDITDKQTAWNELHKLTNNENISVRSEVASILGFIFSQIPNKHKAWDDLHKLTNDEDSYVRFRATYALGSAFSDVPDKKQIWDDLHKLTNDVSWEVRSSAVRALGSVFSQVPDKQQAWDDLHRLTDDEDNIVRSNAAYALGYAYSQVLDKQQAWNDLHKLTLDEDIEVIGKAAIALGSVFSQVPAKQQAWDDLHRLASDKDNYVRTFSNHSLGRVSIFKASQANKEEDYKKELEKAIEYFEKAVPDSPKGDNPSKFCLPLYRSFHTVIFKKQAAKEEVDKYLAEAKDAIKDSKSKKLLFEAVENLATALKEVQSIENLDLDIKKSELNFYRKYCDRAADLMKDAEETAPYAIAAMRKGLPILDRNLKGLIEEIKEKAKGACKVSQNTPTQEIACAVNREVQAWEIGNQEEMSWNIENLIFTLESNIPKIPDNQYIFDRIQQVREQKDLAKQYGIVCTIIPLIPRLHMERGISDVKTEISDIKKGVDEVNEKENTIINKLDEIQKELNQGFGKLDLLSFEVGGKEGELIKSFSKRVRELTEKGDKETLDHFLEEILTKENTLIEEIEKSSAPPEEKEESKRSILNIRSVIDKVKHPIKSFGKDVTKEIVVTYTAEEIVKLVFQLVSMATLGVPIPPQVLNLMSDMVKELKN